MHTHFRLCARCCNLNWVYTRSWSNSTDIFTLKICFVFLTAIWLLHGQLLDHYRGGRLTQPVLIIVFLYNWPESHRASCNKVGSLSPAERLVGLESGTFRFWLQRLNPLGHSLQILGKSQKKQNFSPLLSVENCLQSKNFDNKWYLHKIFFNWVYTYTRFFLIEFILARMFLVGFHKIKEIKNC